jgi:trans-2,3-dihydro-3-hydroxyanthranilate isomerase
MEPIGRCRPNLAHWDAAFGEGGHNAVYVFAGRPSRPVPRSTHACLRPAWGSWRTRRTGAAAAAFAGVLAHFAPPSDGDHDLTIEQGYELGRPSLIGLSVTMKNRQLVAAAIAGEAITVSEGTIEA